YRTSDFHEKDRRFEVRGKDLHCWGEVEFEELGWVELDPCPDPAPPEAGAASGQAAEPERTDAKAVRTAIASKRPLVLGLALLLLVALYFAFPTLRLELAKLAGARPPAGISGPARRAWRFWQELLDCC